MPATNVKTGHLESTPSNSGHPKNQLSSEQVIKIGLSVPLAVVSAFCIFLILWIICNKWKSKSKSHKPEIHSWDEGTIQMGNLSNISDNKNSQARVVFHGELRRQEEMSKRESFIKAINNIIPTKFTKLYEMKVPQTVPNNMDANEIDHCCNLKSSFDFETFDASKSRSDFLDLTAENPDHQVFEQCPQRLVNDYNLSCLTEGRKIQRQNFDIQNYLDEKINEIKTLVEVNLKDIQQAHQAALDRSVPSSAYHLPGQSSHANECCGSSTRKGETLGQMEQQEISKPDYKSHVKPPRRVFSLVDETLKTCSSEYEALYNFEALQQDDLPLKSGDVVLVDLKDESGWWRGSRDGRKGWFPGTYVRHAGKEFEDEVTMKSFDQNITKAPLHKFKGAPQAEQEQSSHSVEDDEQTTTNERTNNYTGQQITKTFPISLNNQNIDDSFQDDHQDKISLATTKSVLEQMLKNRLQSKSELPANQIHVLPQISCEREEQNFLNRDDLVDSLKKKFSTRLTIHNEVATSVKQDLLPRLEDIEGKESQRHPIMAGNSCETSRTSGLLPSMPSSPHCEHLKKFAAPLPVVESRSSAAISSPLYSKKFMNAASKFERNAMPFNWKQNRNNV